MRSSETPPPPAMGTRRHTIDTWPRVTVRPKAWRAENGEARIWKDGWGGGTDPPVLEQPVPREQDFIHPFIP